ncbi:uncharacterized protein LOC123321146 [Coccinella septempunctata]|uniref:uncharacterized protein LOC123321146 n=1 Tax=Coccinella septempunctata TaxID=41139 RepID=UPI001D074C1C|nr:uncharacterized protein LOC123321146 [Coccinella septempunctata]
MYLFHIVLLASILQIAIGKNEEKVAKEQKLRYKRAFYDTISSEEEYHDYFNPLEFLHRNFHKIKEKNISKSVTDRENQNKNSEHQKQELQNLIKKISGNKTINIVNSNDELDNSEEQKLKENEGDRSISPRNFPIFLRLNEGEVLKMKKMQPTSTKEYEEDNRNNKMRKNKKGKSIAGYNNLPHDKTTLKNTGAREENNKKHNKANKTNKNTSPQRKTPVNFENKEDTKIISDKPQKKNGVTKPTKKTLFKHNGQEKFKVQTTRPSFEKDIKSGNKHKKTEQKYRNPIRNKNTADININQEKGYSEDYYYDDYGLIEESEEYEDMEINESSSEENQSDVSGDYSSSEYEDSIEDDSSDPEARNAIDSNETDEDEDSDSEEIDDDYSEEKSDEKRGPQLVQDASELPPTLLEFNNNNHELQTSCDHTWTYYDKPLRMLEKKNSKYRSNSLEGSSWKGLKPREGNLLDLLGNFCGSLAVCTNGSTLSMSPWVPLLLKKGTEVERFLSIRCGVTLISKSHAITSAKCVLKANTDPLYIIFGNFDFENADKDGILRVVETIALAGEDLSLAVLTFKELTLHDQIRPICISSSEDSFEENTRTATVVWNWTLEHSNKTEDFIYENFCALTKRSDKKMSDLLPAKKVCPQANGIASPICMRTKPEALWSADDTIPGLPLLYEYQNTWFLKGITLDETTNESTKKVQKKQIRRIKFESIDRFIDDINKIITQVV